MDKGLFAKTWCRAFRSIIGWVEFTMCATRVCAKRKIVHDSGHAKMAAKGGKRTFLSHRFFRWRRTPSKGPVHDS